ncbi:MAG: betaine--homocysteine S-methyltransferase [Amaricoccus sp.]|uniref:betaine--homocysteine S-methyltransferase n=1 Tax=Amaricoccus sp. TaxID=1872485 RepID=UPI0039E6D9D7
MATSLYSLLAERAWLLADGATGTNLFAMGLESGEAPELWNESEPDKVRALYDGAIGAGSDIFLTNSFGGNASRLRLHEAETRVFALNRAAAEIAREAADAAGRPVVVAGSMGPTGEIMAPLGPLSIEAAAEMFEEQARGLLAGGADVLWIETMSAPDELTAAAIGIGRTGAPWCCTMSFDTAGRTMMGLTAADMVALVAGLDHPPLAFGANCGVGASDLLRTVLGFGAAHATLPVIAKGNAGIPKFVDGHIHYDGTPELMADYAVLARDCGARIIGGCCGTTPAHLAAMRGALVATPPGPVPDLDTIAARLGAFSSASDGSGGDAPARERRRRRT